MSFTISDDIVVQRRDDSGTVPAGFQIWAPHAMIELTADQAEQLAVFVQREIRLQRYPAAVSPAKARLSS